MASGGTVLVHQFTLRMIYGTPGAEDGKRNDANGVDRNAGSPLKTSSYAIATPHNCKTANLSETLEHRPIGHF